MFKGQGHGSKLRVTRAKNVAKLVNLKSVTAISTYLLIYLLFINCLFIFNCITRKVMSVFK